MTRDDARLWTDWSCLRDVQYRTGANLAARKAIYACQRPRLDLPSRVLGPSAPQGDETVADIGCGNGAYLAELARRRHAGPVLGVDLSAGMMQAAAAGHRARAWSPGTPLPCHCVITPAA
jgi:SAM-dependent methyltransferase